MSRALLCGEAASAGVKARSQRLHAAAARGGLASSYSWETVLVLSCLTMWEREPVVSFIFG